ncbi:MAG: glutathione S-transferase N-terminal domain-containing protein [Oceanospirillaceae bacterium]|nr:glutathione S-transferase N-terminal domain-containing protein [Oceanospirillaceae bacterium]
MAIIRWILGRIILLVDFLTTPRGVKRPAEQQAVLDNQTARLALYQYKACPFCVKVRRTMKRQSLSIETRDAKNDAHYRQELIEQGGKLKVPCLRIESDNGEIQWMYESGDIVRYLDSVAA